MISDVIFFAINTVFFAVFALSAFMLTSKRKPKFSVKPKSRFHKTIFICTDFSVVLLILEISGVADCGAYRLFSLWNVIFGAGVLLLFKAADEIAESFKKTVFFAIRLFVVCFALEAFVFNLNSTHLFFGGYKEKILDMSTASCENFDISTGQNIGSGYSALEFKDFNAPVGTVSFEAFSSKKGYVKMSVDMTDESYSAKYRYGIATAYVLRNNERSQTIPCNFSGRVRDIKFSFNADDDEVVMLSKITVNKPITLEFSFIRFSAVYFGSLIIYLLAVSEFFKKSFSQNRRGIRVTVWVFTGVLIAVSLLLVNIPRYKNDDHSIAKDFKSESGNQLTQEIVDAFEKGRTSLDIEMNERLMEIENPYDGGMRDEENIGSYPWDHLYFNGKYYSYYGIAPVLAVFLPYHHFTGHYFPSCWAVWLFGVIGIIFLTKLYLCFIDKFFSKTRSSLVFLGLFIIQLSSGVWFCFNFTNFYEISQTSGFLCTTAGAFFMLSSNVVGEGKIKNRRVALSTLFLSLAVLCRPTLAVYCVAALLFIYAGFRKKKEEISASKGKIKPYIPYFLCAFIPFIVFGSVQMFYNFARFGNPFDFGIQYSLTINDFTSAQYHTHFVLIGFFNYLFTIPKFSENFPFFVPNEFSKFCQQGFYFVATPSVIGILWKALPLLSYSKSARAYRLCENRNKKLNMLLVSAVCIICPFVIIASVWESGYCIRYSVDFAWQFILGALIIAFIVYEKCRENTKKHLNKLMIISAVISLILNFGYIFDWAVSEGDMSADWYAGAMSFARAFEFWR